MHPYSSAQSSRKTIGIVSVVVLHALLIWGLVSGLARDVVKLVKQTVEVKVIEEAPPPPPPPPPPKPVEKVIPTTPPPQQAYVPPPEITPPTPSAAAITSVKADPTPPPPPAPPPPVSVPKGPVGAKGVCQIQDKPDYPRKALNDEIEGSVQVRFRVDGNGQFSTIESINYKGIPNAYRTSFQSAIATALRSYRCNKDLAETPLEADFNFKLE